MSCTDVMMVPVTRLASKSSTLTRLTGQGKTEAVIQALELYQTKLLALTQAVIAGRTDTDA
jgi:hypothetical protein